MPHRPVLLGVVGDSAAGKTTISAGIADILGPDQVTVICVDDYHKYNRSQRKELGITPLHPDCNFIDIMEQHVHALADGKPILKPVYNHARGDFDPPEYIKPKQYVIIEGLLAFHSEKLREAFHEKVYLDPPEELRRAWKIKRDCAKRGYKPEEVILELERREHDSATHIRSQKQWADLVVSFYPSSEPPDNEHLNVRLTLRPSLPHPDLSQVVAGSSSALRLTIERERGRLSELLDVDGLVNPEQVEAIEQAVWSQQPELRHWLGDDVGHFADGHENRQSRPLAVSQLLIAYHLLLTRLAKEQLRQRLLARETAVG